MAEMCVLMAAILLLCYSGHLFSSSVDGRTGGASHIAHKTHICSEYLCPDIRPNRKLKVRLWFPWGLLSRLCLGLSVLFVSVACSLCCVCRL